MKRKLQVCMQHRSGPGSSCGVRHQGMLLDALVAAVRAENLEVDVEPINCFVKCEQGPNIKLMPEGKFWHRATQQTLQEIVDFLHKTRG